MATGVYKVKPSDDIRFDYMRLIGISVGEHEEAEEEEEEDPLTRSLSAASTLRPFRRPWGLAQF